MRKAFGEGALTLTLKTLLEKHFLWFYSECNTLIQQEKCLITIVFLDTVTYVFLTQQLLLEVKQYLVLQALRKSLYGRVQKN